MSEPMPDDVFDRLTSVERAQFLYESAQRRHAEALDRQQAALDRQQADLDRHAAMHQDHQSRMAHLETLLERQQEMQTTLLQMMGTMHERLAQNEAMLKRLIDSQRHRNGH